MLKRHSGADLQGLGYIVAQPQVKTASTNHLIKDKTCNQGGMASVTLGEREKFPGRDLAGVELYVLQRDHLQSKQKTLTISAETQSQTRCDWKCWN